VQERERMLSEMETDEIENGEDIEAWFAEDAMDEDTIMGGDEASLHEYNVPGAFVE
jgi:hypothetical protein